MGFIRDLKATVRMFTNSNASLNTGEIRDVSDTKTKGPLGFDSARTGFLKRLAANPSASEFAAALASSPQLATPEGRARAVEISQKDDAGQSVKLAPEERGLANAVFVTATSWTSPKANTQAAARASERTNYLLKEFGDIGEPGAWRAREASYAVDTGAATREQALAALPPDAKDLFLKAESKTQSANWGRAPASAGWGPK